MVFMASVRNFVVELYNEKLCSSFYRIVQQILVKLYIGMGVHGSVIG
jgi:hypothetical protein